MNFKQTAIDNFAKFLLSGILWKRIRHIVELVNEQDLTGAEKRAQVISEVETVGIDLAGFMLNLGIELAVAYFKIDQSGEANAS